MTLDTTLCEAVHGIGTCGYGPEETFVCPRCERTVCFCDGAHDDTPALCCDCACEIQGLFEMDACEVSAAREPRS